MLDAAKIDKENWIATKCLRLHFDDFFSWLLSFLDCVFVRLDSTKCGAALCSSDAEHVSRVDHPVMIFDWLEVALHYTRSSTNTC